MSVLPLQDRLELRLTHIRSEHSAPEMGVYVGCFSHDGEKLFFGSAKGMLSVVVLRTRHVAFQARVVDLKASVKEVAISRRGRFVLINTTDRQIRAMPIDHITGLPLTHYTVRYKNTVEQCQWDACCFSPDEDYVVGGRKGTQELYIWDRLTGNLKRKLEGPQEGVSIVNIAVESDVGEETALD